MRADPVYEFITPYLTSCTGAYLQPSGDNLMCILEDLALVDTGEVERPCCPDGGLKQFLAGGQPGRRHCPAHKAGLSSFHLKIKMRYCMVAVGTLHCKE